MNILDLAEDATRFPSAVAFLCGTSGVVEEICVDNTFVFEPGSPYAIVEAGMAAIRQSIDVPTTCATDTTRADMRDMMETNTVLGIEYLMLNQVGDLTLTGVAIETARATVFAANPKPPVLYLRGSALKAALASDLVKGDRDGLYTVWGDEVVVLQGAYTTPLGANLGFWSSDVVVQLMEVTVEEIMESRANTIAYYLYRPALVLVSPCATAVIATI